MLQATRPIALARWAMAVFDACLYISDIAPELHRIAKMFQ
jgi:hypothetical protein